MFRHSLYPNTLTARVDLKLPNGYTISLTWKENEDIPTYNPYNVIKSRFANTKIYNNHGYEIVSDPYGGTLSLIETERLGDLLNLIKEAHTKESSELIQEIIDITCKNA